ncbi:MAG: 4-hydroxy-tetrahydrodipicolinate reductase [Candidatus Kapabacteria bacterium]|nr:4-hydroxy-tetrahydrodipicolinate reductase [Candidatus Kapabacteria bacterium]
MPDLVKIALIGFGSMGKEIKRLADNSPEQFNVTEIFEIDKKISSDGKYDFDVAIDFTHPNQVIENLKTLAALGKNCVIGTTGWYDSLNDAKEIVEKANIGVVYGSNFSIGVQLFLKIIELSSKSLNQFEEYDIFVHEIHHKNKIDSPSGTALSIGKVIIDNLERKKEIFTETSHTKISPEQLHISSTRGGEVPGKHTVYIDSLADTIEISHSARNRSGFAFGALKAASWIKGKKGFFDFSNVFNSLLEI